MTIRGETSTGIRVIATLIECTDCYVESARACGSNSDESGRRQAASELCIRKSVDETAYRESFGTIPRHEELQEGTREWTLLTISHDTVVGCCIALKECPVMEECVHQVESE
jgi:hypothetical protein